MTWGIVVTGYSLALIAAALFIKARTIGPAAIRFGRARTRPIDEREVLIEVYRAQQKQAFKLTLIAVAAGVLLGVALITRLAAARALDATVLASVIGSAGNIWLGAGAMRLYKEASRRLEEAVRGVVVAPEVMR